MDRCKICNVKFTWIQVFKMFESAWLADTKCINCGTVHKIKISSRILLGVFSPIIILGLGYILYFNTTAISVILLIIGAIISFLLLPQLARLKPV